MNGTPIPGTKKSGRSAAAKSLSSGSRSRRGSSRRRSGGSGSSGDGSRLSANELARRFGDLDHRGGNAMSTSGNMYNNYFNEYLNNDLNNDNTEAFDIYTKTFSANNDIDNYYSYSDDDIIEDGYLEIDAERNTDFDEEWESNNLIWDEVSEFTTTNGKRIGQKCLHMWGQRLCLCQFLGWLDSSKYKC
eukprot:963721_1